MRLKILLAVVLWGLGFSGIFPAVECQNTDGHTDYGFQMLQEYDFYMASGWHYNKGSAWRAREDAYTSDSNHIDHILSEIFPYSFYHPKVYTQSELDQKVEDLKSRKQEKIDKIKAKIKHLSECPYYKKNPEFAPKTYDQYVDEIDKKIEDWRKNQQEKIDMKAKLGRENDAALIGLLVQSLGGKELEEVTKEIASLTLAQSDKVIQKLFSTNLTAIAENQYGGALTVPQASLDQIAHYQKEGNYHKARQELFAFEPLLKKSTGDAYPFVHAHFQPQIKVLADAQAAHEKLSLNKRRLSAGLTVTAAATLLAAGMTYFAREHKHYSDAALQKLSWYRRYPVELARKLGLYRHHKEAFSQ